jgi:hypothetical protein
MISVVNMLSVPACCGQKYLENSSTANCSQNEGIGFGLPNTGATGNHIAFQ